ncbi:MAG TPA: TetR/AcrR family transcriptional regulator [Mycobacteriales bacterium]|nr:TetR/AcrR family transcriptional regulator [Mycobacteriales bacterium]
MTATPAAPTPATTPAPTSSVPPPAEPLHARTVRMPRSARRKQLLRAAREVFVAHGYHAAAMDDIAERAGVSKPVLYQHFPGKLDLYLALLETHAEDLVERMRQAMAGTTDNKARVHNAVSAYFDFVDSESEAFRLVFESDLRNDPAVREKVDRMERGLIEAITDTVAADTGLDRPRAELLAVGLTGMSEIAARWWLDRASEVPKQEAVRLIESLAWRGISNFPLQTDPRQL